MTNHQSLASTALLALAVAATAASAQPSPAAVSAFNSYTRAVESRLAAQHQSEAGFIPSDTLSGHGESLLHQAEPIVADLATSSCRNLPGALLHHWRGTAFVPGVSAADLERLLKDFQGYPRYFAPQLLQANAVRTTPDHLLASMRVRQQHVLTVVMDTTYDVSFGALDSQHRYSASRSTQISEIASPGTGQERVLNQSEEHGFLWRQNTYWTYEERDGGLVMQIESVSLTRSIPTGLGWALRPFVESVPRESLEFTLRSTRNALLSRKNQPPNDAAPTERK